MEKTYTKHIGRSGRVWLVPVGEFAGDGVHCAADPRENASGYQGFRGYGGSTLTFALEGGGEIKLEGPWHSNSKALFEDTGVDVRRCHASKVTIASTLRKSDNPYRWPSYVPDTIIFEEQDFKAGLFERCNLLVTEWVERLGKPLYYVITTGGGGQSGWEYPKSWTPEQRKAFHETAYPKEAPKKTGLQKVFKTEIARIQKGKCPICAKPIDSNKFRDALSRKEYGISGMCQKCQDKTFK